MNIGLKLFRDEFERVQCREGTVQWYGLTGHSSQRSSYNFTMLPLPVPSPLFCWGLGVYV